MYELIGDSRAAAYLIPLITVGLGGLVGWGLKLLIGPAGQPKNAIELGRRWAGWIVLGTSMSMLSQFFGKLDFLSFFKWLVGGGIWVAVAYVLGWGYGKFFKFKSAAQSPTSDVPNTSSNSYSPPAEKNTSSPPLQPPHSAVHTDADENAIYAAIAEELKSGNADQGLWIRLFAECDGDENKTKARYVTQRAIQLGGTKQHNSLQDHVPTKVSNTGLAVAVATTIVLAVIWVGLVKSHVFGEPNGLQWEESDNGGDINWNDANAYCAKKGNGWRLPTTAELKESHRTGQSTPCGPYTCKVASKSRLTGPWFWSNEPSGSTNTLVGSSNALFVTLTYGLGGVDDVENRLDKRALCVRPLGWR